MNEQYNLLSIDRIFKELHQTRYTHPLHENVWGEVKCISRKTCSTPTYLISSLYTPPHMRGQGLARELMELFCELADRSEITLLLKAASFDATGPTDEQLKEYYTRFEFTSLPIGKVQVGS